MTHLVKIKTFNNFFSKCELTFAPSYTEIGDDKFIIKLRWTTKRSQIYCNSSSIVNRKCNFLRPHQWVAECLGFIH